MNTFVRYFICDCWLQKNDIFQATVEIQTDSISKGKKVLIVDDLLATGGKKIDFIYDLLKLRI